MSTNSQTAGKTAELVDLFADSDIEGGELAVVDGIDLSVDQIAKIASIHLYDHLYVVQSDRQKMQQAHAKIEKNIPGKHRKGIKRTHLSTTAWQKACKVASAITGEEYTSSADTLNDPTKTASRMAGFVRDYIKFKKNYASYSEGSNGYKLAQQMGLIAAKKA